MAHGDDGHGHDHGHGSDSGHGHGKDHGHGSDHGHGGGHAPEPAPVTPPHVFTIARITRWIGLGMMASFLLGAVYYQFFHTPEQCGRVAWSAFFFVYGLCIWRAAADTLSRDLAAPASRAH